MQYDRDEHSRVQSLHRQTLDLMEYAKYIADRSSPEVAKALLAFRDSLDDAMEDDLLKGALHLIENAELDEMPCEPPVALPAGHYG